MSSRQTWDPDRYARHARFVSELGTPVVELLAPQPRERILDLGCGDGALTAKLAALEGDVVLCGDDAAARTEVAALVAKLPGLRAVDAGRLANARYLEAITALLLNLNRRFRARTSIAIVGLG